MMRSTLIAALVSAALPMMALAQTADELKNDEKTPGDVLTYGMGYSQNGFSPARAHQSRQRQTAGAGLVLQHGRQSRPGSASAGQGRHHLSHGSRKDGRARCAVRQADLEIGDRISARYHARRLLRHRQPWRRAVRWQTLPHHA